MTALRALALALAMTTATSHSQGSRGHAISASRFEGTPGAGNAITDVAGVTSGR
jgi:hypothetical protein